jgi:hypothetical protein
LYEKVTGVVRFRLSSIVSSRKRKRAVDSAPRDDAVSDGSTAAAATAAAIANATSAEPELAGSALSDDDHVNVSLLRSTMACLQSEFSELRNDVLVLRHELSQRAQSSLQVPASDSSAAGGEPGVAALSHAHQRVAEQNSTPQGTAASLPVNGTALV